MHIRPNDPVPAIRRELAQAIVRALGPFAQYGLSAHFGIPKYRMAELENGNVSHVSAEWLIRRIYRMGGKVCITVSLGDVASEWTRAAIRAAAPRPDRVAKRAPPAPSRTTLP